MLSGEIALKNNIIIICDPQITGLKPIGDNQVNY